MKRSAVVVLALAVLLASPMASAKRFGGGFSFGKQSGMVTKRMAPAPTKPAAPTRSATANGAAAGATGAAAAARPGWGGMLGGLAAGLGLAWLASSLGLGEGFGVILLVALGAMLVMVLLRSMRRGMARPAYADARGGASPVAFAPPPAPSSRSGSIIGASLGGSAQPETWGIPEDFDVVGFERAAKQHFVDIQAAWDAADLKAMGELMTDDMLQQIAQQLREREEALGGRPNTTEVLALHARLLGIEEVTNGYVASVEFHGEVREEPGEPAASFREVWNITKARQGGGWLVAGVQALN